MNFKQDVIITHGLSPPSCGASSKRCALGSLPLQVVPQLCIYQTHRDIWDGTYIQAVGYKVKEGYP